ncbi:MAG TPA: DUF192 domain-containing protein [Geminicoccaceae bacterium]|nr:DUF192 domain-containing protein [Geminicoccaceae bacterium]
MSTVPPVPTVPALSRDRTPARPRQAVPRRAALAALLAALVLAAPPGRLLAQSPGELVVETVAGRHRFTVELADTPAERSRGLMFRESMPADHGMLFDFQAEQPVAFWMKNTPLPLDMVFIDGAGTVVQVAADTTPYSEASIPSRQPVRAVLELNAGTAARRGIRPGAKVRHPIFGGEE